MTYKVKLVRMKKPCGYFTEGKIYEVVDGVIISDDDYEFFTWSQPWCNKGRDTSFESLKRWFEDWYDFELVDDEEE